MREEGTKGVWQGEDMDLLKYDKSMPCQTLYALRAPLE
jgi:hypothetical protein